MARGTSKSSDFALRRRKAEQKKRKAASRKTSNKKPSWVKAIKKTFVKDGAKGTRSSYLNPEGDEVQSEVDPEREKKLNEKQPLDTQLFCKNLPLDADADEVQAFFARFGEIRRVFIVRNHTTKMATGTGFVHCASKELVDTIMNHCQQNARELAASTREEIKKETEALSHHKAKQVQFKLRNDKLEVKDPFVTIRNNRVTVHRVLSRTDSHEAVSQAQKKKKRTRLAGDDPRNLYLLQEGHITADSPAAKGLPPQYLELLRQDYESRKQQLRNTNYFVSRTRLNIRNLPRTIEAKELRQLLSKHTREYLKKHPELLDREAFGKYGPIKNVKLLTDSAGTPKGFAFVEFVSHELALNGLRSLNNNPTIFGPSKRLIVSFAVESMNAVQKLERLRQLRNERNQRPASEGD
jgi:nucleolar protein 4